MKIAFDCDGVLGYDGVDEIRELASILKSCGNEVWIVTAVPKDWEGTGRREEQLKQIAPGWPYKIVYSDGHEEAGKLKAEVMKELGINLLIDDTVGVCTSAKANGVQVLHLLK